MNTNDNASIEIDVLYLLRKLWRKNSLSSLSDCLWEQLLY